MKNKFPRTNIKRKMMTESKMKLMMILMIKLKISTRTKVLQNRMATLMSKMKMLKISIWTTHKVNLIIFFKVRATEVSVVNN